MSAERPRALVQPSDFLPKVGGSVTFLVLRTRRRSSRLEDLRVRLIKSNRKRTRAYLAPSVSPQRDSPITTSVQVRLPAEFKHITKPRKRN